MEHLQGILLGRGIHGGFKERGGKMGTIFNITEDKMKETSSTFTLIEIYQQPATWEKTCNQI